MNTTHTLPVRNRLIRSGVSSLLALIFLVGSLSTSAAPASLSKRSASSHQYVPRGRYGVPTFADSTVGDDATYDDPTVRAAAVRGLGRFNGSVVAIDPNSGRILTIVNQKLAFSAGFKPCSTIKPVVAVAALQEGFVTRDTKIHVERRKVMNLTEAIAHSNNVFFEELGRRMGFEMVSTYARELGLGELAGYDIPEEKPGVVPSEPPRFGGVARMSSFGEGIEMTPLQLGALVATVANGGTLYYLQYPRSTEEQQGFEPRVKRTLDIKYLPDLRDGMHAAVIRGTAVRSNMPDDEDASGKTGSCSEDGTRLGWFASYVDQPRLKMVLVILMRGDTYAVRGPMAAGIAGRIYHRLNQEEFFTQKDAQPEPTTLTATAAQ